MAPTNLHLEVVDPWPNILAARAQCPLVLSVHRMAQTKGKKLRDTREGVMSSFNLFQLMASLPRRFVDYIIHLMSRRVTTSLAVHRTSSYPTTSSNPNIFVHSRCCEIRKILSRCTQGCERRTTLGTTLARPGRRTEAEARTHP